MIVESLLDWAAAILQETESAPATEILAGLLSRQFHDAVDRLEVLLSLDKRFVRGADGGWQLSRLHPSQEGLIHLVNQALTLREQAAQALLKERQVAEDEAHAVRNRLEEISDRLAELGHQPTGAAVQAMGHEEPYSLECVDR